MKKLYFILFFYLLIFIPSVNAESFSLYSDNVLLYNVEENKVMYEKNADKKVGIASVTKAVSTAVMLDFIDKDKMDDEIDFKKVDYLFLKEKDLSISSYDRDKTYTYKDFLYSFIMESSADCGYALMYTISDNSKEFSTLMNKKALELGMNNSHFDNPVGLDSKGNYSTMRDMATFMTHALYNQRLLEIMSTFTYKASDGNVIYHTIKGYTNRFELNMPYLKGGKTGYNDEPGFALLSYAKSKGSTYILATTKAPYDFYSPNHFLDAKKLYDYYFKNYGYKKLIAKNDGISILNGKYTSGKVRVGSNSDVLYYLKNNYDKRLISFKNKDFDDMKLNYKKGDVIGTINVYYDKKFLKKIDVISLDNSSFSLSKFITYNKYVIIAFFSYLIIIISTYLIVKKIKKKESF